MSLILGDPASELHTQVLTRSPRYLKETDTVESKVSELNVEEHNKRFICPLMRALTKKGKMLGL